MIADDTFYITTKQEKSIPLPLACIPRLFPGSINVLHFVFGENKCIPISYCLPYLYGNIVTIRNAIVTKLTTRGLDMVKINTNYGEDGISIF